jgi:oligoendopeptidase F
MIQKELTIDRRQVPDRYRWNAESVYKNHDSWRNACDELTSKLLDAQNFHNRLHESPDQLLAWIRYLESVMTEFGKINVYAVMSASVDMQDQRSAALMSKARSLMGQVQAATAFNIPEIAAIGANQLADWMENHPQLAIYAHYFQRILDQKPHIRSAEVEEILGRLQDQFKTTASIHGTLSDTDLTFQGASNGQGEQFEVNQASIGALLTNPEQMVRQSAWENYADGYLRFQNTLAACLTAGIKQDVFSAQVRNYASSLEAALDEYQIPVTVFDTLIDTFKTNLPVWHRYWRLRRQALGYDTLHVYDIKAPLAEQPAAIPFEEAVEWICAGLRPLGEEYVSVLRNGVLQDGWVDSYPNRGKRSGAFSSGAQGTHPFINMSYNQDIYGLSTLAHELGHSMHSYLTWQHQPNLFSRYSLFAAEVASNFNQAMVRAYMLDEVDDRSLLIAILEEAMSNFHRYLFIMPTLARFELTIHEMIEQGEALPAAKLNSMMTDLFAEGYGGEVAIDSDRIGITWAQFPNHMYRNFYVYQYATGIAGAHALANNILDGQEGAVDRYLVFLKTGGSRYPLEALRLAGVDLAAAEPVQTTFRLLENIVERLESLLKD